MALRCLSTISGSDQSVFAKKENATATLLVASQKTLPVMVAVVEPLHGALGESSLVVLLCVAAHLLLIVMDSILVNIWLKEDNTSNSTNNGVIPHTLRPNRLFWMAGYTTYGFGRRTSVGLSISRG